MNPELLVDYSCVIGENPLWHPLEKRVYWTDIATGRLFWYDPVTGEHACCYQGEPVGGFTIQPDGALLLFGTRGAIKLWRPGQLTTVIVEIPAERDSRFNDVIADPVGRVFCGTMPTGDQPGSLYRLGTDGQLTHLFGDVLCSNGLAFSFDRKQLYYTDSYRYTIYRFAYDLTSGEITDRQTFLEIPKELGFPDGMTLDSEGCLWSAIWDGGCLIRFSAAGEEMLRIPFPARKVSSLTFGGPGYQDIYITTAGGEHKDIEGAGAGALFRLRLGISGNAEYPSRITLPV